MTIPDKGYPLFISIEIMQKIFTDFGTGWIRWHDDARVELELDREREEEIC
jgi:hypothetical protein